MKQDFKLGELMSPVKILHVLCSKSLSFCFWICTVLCHLIFTEKKLLSLNPCAYFLGHGFENCKPIIKWLYCCNHKVFWNISGVIIKQNTCEISFWRCVNISIAVTSEEEMKMAQSIYEKKPKNTLILYQYVNIMSENNSKK